MYELIDSGNGRKLERFGEWVIDRPSAQAVWHPQRGNWRPHATFTREPDGKWEGSLPESWVIEIEGIRFLLSPTDFGHLGIFPEQNKSWNWIRSHSRPGMNVLNLFAYSGGSTMAAAQGGAKVTHLDASKKMIAWAKENAALNGVGEIRWIVDDVRKFLKREVKRGTRYDGIILDPPTFGRGAQGEVFKIEKDLLEILALCQEVFTDKPAFLLLTCHSPGFTPLVMQNLLGQMLEGSVEVGEMVLAGKIALPSGVYARWNK
jgi:23S rRNA (cytosine1962-C5)-methyltransferase